MRRTSRLLAATITLAMLGAPAVVGSSTTAALDSELRASLTVSATKPAIVLGQSTRISGVLRPRAGGVKVALQSKFSSGWGIVTGKKTNAQGEFGFRVTPSEAGIRSYRVVRLNRLREITLRSNAVTVTTYRWHNLNDVRSRILVDSDNVNDFDGPADIAGDTYPRSILLDSDDTAEENDGPGFIVIDTTRCAALSTVLGALDDNTAGTSVRGKVTGDDEVLSNETYAVGESDSLLLDIREYAEVRVDVVDVQQDVKRGLGVGTPMVLCAMEAPQERASAN